VHDDVRIETRIPVGIGSREDPHLHPRIHAVRGGPEVRVVRDRAVLGVRVNVIVAESPLPEIIRLEIARRLVETTPVKPVVHDVVDVEKIGHSRERIGRRQVLERVVENEWIHPRRLPSPADGRLVIRRQVLLRIDVVPQGLISGHPAVGGFGHRVHDSVGEDFEALRGLVRMLLEDAAERLHVLIEVAAE
jgi:hypothetical protein